MLKKYSGSEVASILRRYSNGDRESQDIVVRLVNQIIDDAHELRTPENFVKAFKQLRAQVKTAVMEKRYAEQRQSDDFGMSPQEAGFKLDEETRRRMKLSGDKIGYVAAFEAAKHDHPELVRVYSRKA